MVPRLRDIVRRCGALLALLALAVQLAAVALVLPAAASRAAAAQPWVAPICHADAGPHDAPHGPLHRPLLPCAACPFCQAVAQAGLLLGPAAAPVLAAPDIRGASLPALPPSDPSPAAPLAAPFPRGPPAPR
jgi:hypothetical protein